MEQQAKGQSAKKSSAGKAAAEPVASEEELNLQREYDALTDTLNDLRRKADTLRRENELLQEEANRTRTESQEYADYMAGKMENRQRAAAALGRHNEDELRRLRKEGEATLERYTEQANELKEEILRKEEELLSLNAEIAELMEFKNLQQEQLGRIAELQNEVVATHLSHSQSLQALKTGFLSEKERYEAQAKQKVHALTLAANREAPSCLMSHAQEVTQENQQLREELRRLIRQAQALRTQHGRLQEQRQQLLLDREHTHKLRMLVTELAGASPP
ncbi:coiled-coil domain-containing protein 166 [Scleropages formosus]|uniref:DUF4515 domain-containing protein n=1 Tax=Scleropages formosus TaxID=113540 RepID=A0A8C9SBV4_SCLFO|nr:coiled-coil domain-containing protein 166 [Scleropages formosus]